MGEYEKRHANREERIRERWGRLAGLVLPLSEDPQSTEAWQRGSLGETKLAKALAKVNRDDIMVLGFPYGPSSASSTQNGRCSVAPRSSRACSSRATDRFAAALLRRASSTLREFARWQWSWRIAFQLACE